MDTLGLPDCLNHETGGDDDQRSEIDLSRLTKLDFLWIHVSWIFSAVHLGELAQPLDLGRNKLRIVSLLPQSIRELCFGLDGDGGDLDRSMAHAIEYLVERHVYYNEFPNLQVLDVASLTYERTKFFISAFTFASANGIPVYLRDMKQWW